MCDSTLQMLHIMTAGNPCCGCKPYGAAMVKAASTKHAIDLIKRSRRIFARVDLTDRAADACLFKVTKPEALRRVAEPTYSGKPPGVRLHLGTYRGNEFVVIGAL